MFTPVTRNITIYTRATFEDPFEFRYDDGTSFDLTGCIVESQIWNLDRSILYISFDIIFTDRTNGEFLRRLTDEATAALEYLIGEDLYTDLALTLSDGTRGYAEQGRVKLKRGYS